MVSILEVPSIRRRVSPITVETYQRMAKLGMGDKRAELIRGVIVKKISKSPLHEPLVRRLFRLLLGAVDIAHVVQKESPLTLQDSEPEPDISVVEGTEADYLRQHPKSARFVVEVAVSSLDLDREKIALYAEANVDEYWLVIAERHVVEVFRNPVEGACRDREVLSVSDTLVCQSLPQVQVSLSDLFQDL